MRKLDEKEKANVSGGFQNSLGLKWEWLKPDSEICVNERLKWKDNEKMKAEIRKKAKLDDPNGMHLCVVDKCPGCGCHVTHGGGVCEACRAQCAENKPWWKFW